LDALINLTDGELFGQFGQFHDSMSILKIRPLKGFLLNIRKCNRSSRFQKFI